MLASPWGTIRSKQRIATGPQSAIAADTIREAIEKRRDEWPYPHVYPPGTSQRRDPMNWIALPDSGAANQATILQFNVPSGFYFYMQQLGLFWDNSTTFHFGDFLFTVDQNTPLGGGAYQEVPLEDWQAIPYPLGSITHGPLTLPRAELFSPEDQIRAKVTNVNLGMGAGTVGAWFGGWLIPCTELQFAE